MTRRRLLAALAASLSITLGTLALLLGIADLASVTAKVWMRDWEKQRHVGSANEWTAVHERLNLARRLNPLSADVIADLGRLSDWRALGHVPGSAAYESSRSRAAQFYAEAIEKRPSWGYAWANYAESRLLMGDRGDGFLLALERAITLAPWEPGVQGKVIWIGLAAWEDLPERLRDLLRESVGRSIVFDSQLDEIVRLAIQFDWLDQLIPMLRTERQLGALGRIVEQNRRR
jgi:hypothetical protein